MLVFAPAALAQSPPPPPPPAPPPPAPPAAPVAATLRLSLQGIAADHGRTIALRGATVRVRGTVTPYVAGQRLVVRTFRGKRKLTARSVKLRPDRRGARGRFSVLVRPGRTGRLEIRAVHKATPQLARLTARRRIVVLGDHAGPGARGPLVRLLQRRLSGLHYVVPQSGVFDDGTGRAVIAYRKVRGLARVAFADRAVLRGLLAGRGRFRLKFPGHGHHVEADVSRQVLVLAQGGHVERIYHMSSGAPATPTILGSFRFYSKTLGVNAKGMVDSNYFHGGYAVHGYASVPVFNASHGCLRVPIPNAASIFRWIRLGDRIDLYP
jgi:hypothetical protein